PTAGEHGREEMFRQAHDGLYIDAKHLEVAHERDFPEFAALAESGIVDENADVDLPLSELGFDQFRAIRILKVAGNGEGWHAELAFKVRGHAAKFGGRGRDQRQGMAVARELPGELSPDSTRGAGDKG